MAQHNFIGYEKMPQDLKKLLVDEAMAKKLNKLTWVVTEKVHGANFSFVYENGEIAYAKRKEFLKWEDDFFGFQLMIERYEPKIIRVFKALRQAISFQRATIYGELFGGEYPSAEQDNRVLAIQTGLYYSPNIEFYAFDIAVEEKERVRYYLDYDFATRLFKSAGVLFAEPLFTGNLPEALNYNIEFQSTIPTLLGLPSLIGYDNLAEGVVIKPWQHRAVLGDHERPILKIKNKRFAEEERFHEAEKWSFDNSSRELTIEAILPEIMTFATLNRLHAVVSKIGKPSRDDETRILEIEKLMVEDILEAFEGKFGSMLSEFSEMERGRLHEKLKLKTSQLLYEGYWQRKT